MNRYTWHEIVMFILEVVAVAYLLVRISQV